MVHDSRFNMYVECWRQTERQTELSWYLRGWSSRGVILRPSETGCDTERKNSGSERRRENRTLYRRGHTKLTVQNC